MAHLERECEKLLFRSGLNSVMLEAFEAHILVPAFNVAYLPMVRPVVQILRELRCFGLLEVALPDIEKFVSDLQKEDGEE